jgi:pyruvate dehydrogenase E1 component
LADLRDLEGADEAESREWLEAFDGILHDSGSRRAEELLLRLLSHAGNLGVSVDRPFNTPYCNTVSLASQPPYPGDLEVERRITAIVRWNALAMVVGANRASGDLGGHLASYASAADLFEVGFQHFFRGDAEGSCAEPTADLVFFQPHSAPGVYARAFLEGRLSETHLANYRREVGGKGLSSYPHPRLMPEFWQFPTGSMGLGVITAVYQARFMRYLQNRNILHPSERRVWAFVGDGEMDEPESVAGLTFAARENLDNLIFVVNCNLQRLDGPVRGNGSIVRELERLFAGAGWNVIKLLWGSDWDDLFARDRTGAIVRRLDETLDGELQTYGAKSGAYNRERFFSKTEELSRLVSHMSDEQIDTLTRGGHDPVKIYAAFDAARRHTGTPTVVLAHTKKGYGLGRWGESRMTAHQQKKLDKEGLLWFRDYFQLPLTDDDAVQARLYRPAQGSPEMQYLLERRKALGGFLPRRVTRAPRLEVPPRKLFLAFTAKPETREISTTMAFVRMLSALLKTAHLQQAIVPIVADEARTFGMESLFRQVSIYSHCGQLYEPQDQSDLLPYKEARDGQILEEGINEAAALSSWIAAGTSYSNHGISMLPFYIFYSMFGFQRVGDLIWAAADSRARGFLIGATAGRTTLSGEGLQHQDGTSHLIASTITSCRAYDPCFAYELAIILQAGMKAMLELQEDVFYYVTTMNENYPHPAEPEGIEEGVLRGMYLLRQSALEGRPRVQLMGSGTILREAIAGAELLESDWQIAADVWSVTSFSELRRDGLRTDRARRNGVTAESFASQCLKATDGPVIAASDYVSAVADLIRNWVPNRYVSLGTDGYGRSDTRASLRKFFGVDRTSIAFAAIIALVEEGTLDTSTSADFKSRYGYNPPDPGC